MRIKLDKKAGVESILVLGMHGHSRVCFFSLLAHTSYLLCIPQFFHLRHRLINSGHTSVMTVVVI